MKVYLNEITGVADAITSMFFSKGTWTRELEMEIRKIVFECHTCVGKRHFFSDNISEKKMNDWMDKIVKLSVNHITLSRFIDFSFTVEGLHRGGQDDWDSHAQRFNNRIVRSSTRLSNFDAAVSEWYEDKILPTDIALAILGIKVPESLYHNGIEYVKSINGYTRKDMANNKDVKRGLYMLSLPSNFIFKVNCTEAAHVFKERNIDSTANPEVKLACESMIEQIADWQPQLTRDFFLSLKN